MGFKITYTILWYSILGLIFPTHAKRPVKGPVKGPLFDFAFKDPDLNDICLDTPLDILNGYERVRLQGSLPLAHPRPNQLQIPPEPEYVQTALFGPIFHNVVLVYFNWDMSLVFFRDQSRIHGHSHNPRLATDYG